MTRLATTIVPTTPSESFLISAKEKSYQHQYANIYYERLTALKPVIQRRAAHRWKNVSGNPVMVPRVLEVVKGQLCWVVGTVYMDMLLKPNVMEDIARDRSIPAPPPPKNYCSDDDSIMLEDDSGRIRLVGDCLPPAQLVTGVIIGVLGLETPNGDFEAIDLCIPGMPPRNTHKNDPGQIHVDGPDEWIALVSGLDIGAVSPADAQIQLLIEYLTGALDIGPVPAAHISRLVIAGNSLAPLALTDDAPDTVAGSGGKKARRYGYDTASFSPHPTLALSAHLLDLARALPVHILPGAADPSGTILPQLPFPRALFGPAAAFDSLACETNPTFLHIAPAPPAPRFPTRTLLIHAGQPLSDMHKYLPAPPCTRLALAAATLKWRHMAPTAPDTLWCHPFRARDPFLLEHAPDVYVVGNQPRFQTRVVRRGKEDQADGEGGDGGGCRVVLVPGFAETGVLVLLNLRTLKVKRVKFAVEGMSAGGGEEEQAGDGMDI